MEEEMQKKINKKKLIIASIISVIIISLIVIGAIYIANRDFRGWVDRYILLKDVKENNLPYIALDENETYQIYAYDKYIAVLNKNNLIQYNSSGKEESKQTVEISTPLVATSNRFFLLADKNKQKIYLFSGDNKIWEKDLEGNIARISVNKNGYVAVVLTGTTYKSVIQTFDATGKELFKTYLSNSIAMDIEISRDNKYLAFGEISTTGTMIQSFVKEVSIEKAKETPSESIIYTYTAPVGSLLIDITYQENSRLVCMYDDSIHVIQNKTDEKVMELKEENKKINFASIALENHAFRIVEKSVLLSTEDTVEIKEIGSKKESIYTINSASKEIYSYENAIAINLGAEVHFIGTNGWLLKKYTSTQEVKNIVMASHFAGVVYRNKIELVSF